MIIEKPFKTPLFKAPCNITKKNIMEYDVTNKKLLCVRYNCGRIKWKCRGYRKF